MCCGYSLEAPHRGTYNEYPQSMFSCRNKKKYQYIIWSDAESCNLESGLLTIIGIASPQDSLQLGQEASKEAYELM